MKKKPFKQLRLALAGLALVVSGSIASAQTTNITYTYDTAIPPWNFWFGSAAVTFEWSTNDAATNSASGSLEMDWPVFSGGQEYMWSGYDGAGGNSVAVNLDNYVTEQFDILVDPVVHGVNANGNFGNLLCIANVGWGQVVVGTYTIPTVATSSWQHVSLPIAKGLGSSWGPGFGMQDWNPNGNSPSAPTTYYIDNLKFVAAPPTPQVATQPVNQEVFANKNVNWSVLVTGGQPLSYQWYKGSTALTDGPTGSGSGVIGSTNSSLSITNVSAADIANYKLIVTNSVGSVTSSVVTLAIVAPSGKEAITTLALGPVAFYELNETSNPTTGSAAFDHVGGFAGTYGTTVGDSFDGISGPLGPFFPGFTVPNGAANFPGPNGGSITLPPLNINTNAVTISAWIYPTQYVSDAGIVFARTALTTSGLCWAGGGGNLGYNWNNNSATWGFNTGPLVPLNKWSFVAVVITATDATLYSLNNSSFSYGYNGTGNANQAFEGATLIGRDQLASNRTFGGTIDDVAIFNYSLTPDQIEHLYFAGAGGPPLRFDGANLSWDDFSQNSPYPATAVTTLWEATSLTGPWTAVTGATSPWPVTTTATTQHYYRLKVQ